MAEIPAKLFKYCTAEVGLKILETGKVRFTPPNEFNDPFDLNPAHNFTDEDLDRVTKDQINKTYAFFPPADKVDYQKFYKDNFMHLRQRAEQNLRQLEPALPQMAYDSLSKHFGVFCLTEHKSSLLMWAHYADSHKGCIVEVSLRGKVPEHLYGLNPVTYCKERPEYHYGDREINTKHLFTKSTQWEYESEWRMIGSFQDMEEMKTERGSIHLVPLPKGSITGVYLGIRTEKRHVEAFQRLVVQPAYAQTRLFQTSTDSKRFELQFSPVSDSETPQGSVGSSSA